VYIHNQIVSTETVPTTLPHFRAPPFNISAQFFGDRLVAVSTPSAREEQHILPVLSSERKVPSSRHYSGANMCKRHLHYDRRQFLKTSAQFPGPKLHITKITFYVTEKPKVPCEKECKLSSTGALFLQGYLWSKFYFQK
jgi:hypothetical protein